MLLFNLLSKIDLLVENERKELEFKAREGIIFSIQEIIKKMNYANYRDEIILIGRTITGIKFACRIYDIYNSVTFKLDKRQEMEKNKIFLATLDNLVRHRINKEIENVSSSSSSSSKTSWIYERISNLLKKNKFDTIYAREENFFEELEMTQYQFYSPVKFWTLRVKLIDSLVIKIIEDVLGEKENCRILCQIIAFQNEEIKIFADKMGIIERCIVEYKIQPEKWYRIKNEEKKYEIPLAKNCITNAEIEINASCKVIENFDLTQIEMQNNLQALKVLMVYDIECCKSNDTPGFVDANEDKIIMIGIKISRVGKSLKVNSSNNKYEFDDFNENNCFIEMGFCLGTCDKNLKLHHDTIVVEFESEKLMIESFLFLIKHFKIDILCGYNNNDFDDRYVMTRASKLGIENEQLQVSIMKYDVIKLVKSKKGQKSFGAKQVELLKIPGVISLDLMIVEALKSKSGKYISLGFLSSNILGITKEEMDHHLIPSYYKSKEGRTKLTSYCMQDVECTFKILQVRRYISSLIEESRTKITSITNILLDGISKQIGNIIELFMYDENVIQISEMVNLQGLSYFGGLCLIPKIGLHISKFKIISTLDFNSLYPSIMIANNMGPDTLLFYKDVKKLYPNWVRGEDYIQIGKYELIDNKLKVSYDDLDCVFVAPKHKVSIFTKFLKNFLRMRANVREEIYKIEDELRTRNLDKQSVERLKVNKNTLNESQLSYKLAANGTYGFLGSLYSAKSNKFVASAITCEGRNMLTIVQWMTTNIYIPGGCFPFSNLFKAPPRIIYGDTDSVFVKIKYKREYKSLMQISFIVGTHISVMVSSLFRPPNCLALEKNFGSCMLFSKKKYSSLKHELDTSKSIFSLIQDCIEEYNSSEFDHNKLLNEIQQNYDDLLRENLNILLKPSNSPKIDIDVLVSPFEESIIDIKMFDKHSKSLIDDYQEILNFEKEDKVNTTFNTMLLKKLEKGGDIVFNTYIPKRKEQFKKLNLFMWDVRIMTMLLPKIKYQSKIDHKGIDVVKAGGCKFIKNLQESILKTLLMDTGIDYEERKNIVVTDIKNLVTNIVQNNMPIHEYIESKKIQKNIKSVSGVNKNSYTNEKQPQIITAIKKFGRTKSTIDVSVGSLVHYVMVYDKMGNSMSKNISFCAEDPTYIFDNDLQINIVYYIEKLKKMLMRTITPLYLNVYLNFISKYATKEEKEKLTKENRNILKQQENQIDKIINVSKIDSKIVKNYDDLKTNKYFKNFKNTKKCEMCFQNEQENNSGFCYSCIRNKKEECQKIIKNKIEEQNKLVLEQNNYQTKCNICQSNDIKNKETIICVNVTCDIYWPRKVVEKKINNNRHNTIYDIEDICSNNNDQIENKHEEDDDDDDLSVVYSKKSIIVDNNNSNSITNNKINTKAKRKQKCINNKNANVNVRNVTNKKSKQSKIDNFFKKCN